MAGLEKKDGLPLKAAEKKKIYEAAVKKLEAGAAERLKKEKEQNNAMALQRFNNWITATNLDNHNAQTNYIDIMVGGVDASVLDQIKKKAVELDYKIVVEDVNKIRISFV